MERRKVRVFTAAMELETIECPSGGVIVVEADGHDVVVECPEFDNETEQAALEIDVECSTRGHEVISAQVVIVSPMGNVTRRAPLGIPTYRARVEELARLSLTYGGCSCCGSEKW